MAATGYIDYVDFMARGHWSGRDRHLIISDSSTVGSRESHPVHRGGIIFAQGLGRHQPLRSPLHTDFTTQGGTQSSRQQLTA
jgi:hypothetical protein